LRGEAVDAAPGPQGFVVQLADGFRAVGSRLVLATGIRDELPPVPGLRERWGTGVLHCPYCHGYEVAAGPLGVLATSPHSLDQALLLADWGPTVLYTQGVFEPSPQQRAAAATRGVRIEPVPIAELLGGAPALDAVLLADGRRIALRALFTSPRTQMASPLAAQLGCAFDDGPLGPTVRVDDWSRTTVEGVYAAGDAASPRHNATLAAASGVLAGIGAHRSLALGSS
jgi:thioredoxin reductase